MDDWKGALAELFRAVGINLKSELAPMVDGMQSFFSNNPWGQLFLLLLILVVAAQGMGAIARLYDRAFRQTIERKMETNSHLHYFFKGFLHHKRSEGWMNDSSWQQKELQRFDLYELEWLNNELSTAEGDFRDYRPQTFYAGILFSLFALLLVWYYDWTIFEKDILAILLPVLIVTWCMGLVFYKIGIKKRFYQSLSTSVELAISTKKVQDVMIYIDSDLKRYKTERVTTDGGYYEVVRCMTCLYHSNYLEKVRFQINDTVLAFTAKERVIEVTVSSEFGNTFLIDRLEFRDGYCQSLRKGSKLFDDKLMVTYLNAAFEQRPAYFQTSS
ncbi:hypothetical protein Q9251_21940 [Alkalihalobacillus macyae]|uniref:hypothetical protein n=1 Tax=Guptibacillus hwajinpoensis TaxID=208199 RepID=UPI00273AE13D|nr:hypothetical protein [Alkalihalobacillus macyae]MDP4553516.1 hypothetical protein [Alkalihalobacillus macyae]